MALQGTCQCCFRSSKLTKKETVTRHGWKETGGVRRTGEYGNVFHTGPCVGYKFPPFEVSKDRTEWWREQLRAEIERVSKRLVELGSRPPLMATVGHRAVGAKRWTDRIEHQVEVRVGDAVVTRYNCDCEGLDPFVRGMLESYDQVHETARREAHRYVDSLERDVEMFTKAIDAWKPKPLKEAKGKKVNVHFAPSDWSDHGKWRYRFKTMSFRAWGRTQARGICGQGSNQVTSDWDAVNCVKCHAKRTGFEAA